MYYFNFKYARSYKFYNLIYCNNLKTNFLLLYNIIKKMIDIE